jgi:hypothetical protein
MIQRMRPILFAVMATAAVLAARPAVAGPPLLCFPFEIGSARSLPMGRASWKDTDPKYDVSHLVADTLALLAPSTMPIVRMETLRRATIYAADHPAVAADLLSELKKRSDAKAPLAAFDYGYLVEAFREAEPVYKRALPTDR